ncbi:type I secretion system permease/ATPase [Vibrio rumoiensis]|uniref:ABC transporter n=1 Tax=Vibrio rumoiensis 1S-45 TaxID=1188252 RepID=A0A1E5DZJ9_9VIBR|nr:type I secretion system permease/ATPase [Vibrio rumoiensis]OEF23305.1 ABC transporter [Vibrio rumoiensis 1S-45]
MKDPLLESLIYISHYYGQPHSANSLVNDLPLSDGLLTTHLFPRAAEKAGLTAKLCQLPIDNISPLLFPVVAFLKGGDTCVILDFDNETQEAEIVLAQSEGVTQSIPLEELNRQYSGQLFLIKKRFRYDDRSPEVLKTRNGHWFWGTLWESKNIYRDVLLASILINIFAIATPLFTRLVYDKIVPNLAFDSLWVLSSGIFLIFIFDLVLKLMRSYFIDIAGKKSDLLISSKIFNRVLGIRLEAKPASVGAFAKNMQEFESIREFLTSATVGALIDLPFALLFLFVIFLIAGPLALVPLGAVLILVIYSFLVQRPLKRSIEEGSRLSSQKHANLIESLSGLETLKTFNAQSQFQYRWEEAVAHMSNWSIKTRRLTDSVQNTAGFLQQFVSVAMIIGGVYLIADGQLTMGGLIAATMLSGRAVGPLVQLSMLSTRYNQAKSAMTIIEQVMAMPMEQEEGKRYIHRPVLQGKIQFDDVSFHYPESKSYALRNISFTIQPGERVAIIGRIGSGKSTIQRLIMGLYKATEGSVKIDDMDINQLHHTDVRNNFGCVPQDCSLFFGSIRDNITLGRTQTNDHDVLIAAERAGVTNFTQHDESGLDKQVGEGGAALSGGQRQAIAIARAWLSQPPLLLMDEPTSQMDNRSEALIKQQLKRLSQSETLILITHKTSMLDLVDRLIVMERGHIVADGPKEAVLQKLRGKKAPAPESTSKPIEENVGK